MFTLVNGLTTGMAVFLVAAGLTLVFGIMRILNFAHGAFFMIGAYVASTLVGSAPRSVLALVAAAVVAALVVGVLGIVVQRFVLRRIQHVDEHYMLIATFAVMLVCVGFVKLIWGLEFLSVDPPPGIDTGVEIFSLFVPSFSLFIISSGVVVFLVLDFVIHRAWTGKMITAIARDGWMAELLGINVPAGIMAAVGGSFALAGLAGGLLLPNQTLSPALGDTFLLLAFITVVIGGLGNVRGAFIAAILLGLIDGLNTMLLPAYPGVAVYVGMVAFLLLWPNGILGESRL
ncbi:branched-chain amino acid ABC transporter permease [Aminobacter anthyllidis]|uniref:Branched-chain amino acid ABC transporter permease n=1 Tax=Aminobacter anthyllidis TaxID=1035067 RepID=A0A9X1AGP8_9HYPH|nr:branched-chain amino acid ABC transporter permease [Aminobacter anthyllidis]MBT1159449.1 branched-chain amino acid ABC transporter permease [Aminobacter anthyllidis]